MLLYEGLESLQESNLDLIFAEVVLKMVFKNIKACKIWDCQEISKKHSDYLESDVVLMHHYREPLPFRLGHATVYGSLNGEATGAVSRL